MQTEQRIGGHEVRSIGSLAGVLAGEVEDLFLFVDRRLQCSDERVGLSQRGGVGGGRETETETERDRDRDRDRHRQTQTETDRDRNRDRDRQTTRQADTRTVTHRDLVGGLPSKNSQDQILIADLQNAIEQHAITVEHGEIEGAKVGIETKRTKHEE